MSLSPERQFSELFKQANDLLILLPKNPPLDSIASAFGIAHSAKKLGKRSSIVGEHINERSSAFEFLVKPENLFDNLLGAREFVLSFNTKYNPIIGIRHEQEAEEFRVYLTPEKGIIDPRDFSFIPARFKYDLAFVIGSPDRETLGKTYEDNPDIFYEVPIVNIDFKGNNERFGQLNMVDLTASSVSEIVTGLLLESSEDALDETAAECLYAGIISATESFQKKNSTPRALELSAKLLSFGANQQKIVHALYRNDSLALIKLWGRAMSTIRSIESINLVATTISTDDLVQSRATPDDIPSIIERIRRHVSTGSYYLILLPGLHNETHAYLEASNSEDIFPLLQKFPPSETIGETFVFNFPDSTPEKTEELIISILQNKK